MSVDERVDDAIALWNSNRIQGALAMALIAVEGAAKLDYPAEQSSKIRFQAFIRDHMATITKGPSKNVVVPCLGRTMPLEEVLYAFLRCHLVHEGTVHPDLFFTDPHVEKGQVFQKWTMGKPFGVPKAIVLNILHAVRDSSRRRAQGLQVIP